jgi:hypothetical protein
MAMKDGGSALLTCKGLKSAASECLKRIMEQTLKINEVFALVTKISLRKCGELFILLFDIL